MIHRCNELGMASLDPQWAGGRPVLITIDDVKSIVETAKTLPETVGEPFTRWSIRRLVRYLGAKEDRVVRISRERLRQILATNGVTFQRTKTWKVFNDLDLDVKLDRIDDVINDYPDRTFAFDDFEPLNIRPIQGSGWGTSRCAAAATSELSQAPRCASFPWLLPGW